MSAEERRRHNEQFIRRLIARRPQDRAKYEHLLRPSEEAPEIAVEGARGAPPVSRDLVLETIVDAQRPVLFLSNDRVDSEDVSIRGDEARELVDRLTEADAWLRDLVPLVGRIDVTNFPGEFVGTGWFVAGDVVVTNRHVASLVARWDGRRFAFSRGVGGRTIGGALCTAHERDDALGDGRTFSVKEVLYVERDDGPNDVAFLRVDRRAAGAIPAFLPVQSADVGAEAPVCVVGYPARASPRVIPDQALMNELYRGRYDVKRITPGYTIGTVDGTTRHDCTTLGGSSGSVVIDLATRQAAGLHFAGLYQESNYAVRASVLREYVDRKRWNAPYEVETRPPAVSATSAHGAAPLVAGAGAAGEVTLTIPLTITVELGVPEVGAAPPERAPVDLPRAPTSPTARPWQGASPR